MFLVSFRQYLSKVLNQSDMLVKIFLFSTVRNKHHKQRKNDKTKTFGANFQNQLFAGVLKNECFQKFYKIHCKTLLQEFLFNKVEGFQPEAL